MTTSAQSTLLTIGCRLPSPSRRAMCEVGSTRTRDPEVAGGVGADQHPVADRERIGAASPRSRRGRTRAARAARPSCTCTVVRWTAVTRISASAASLPSSRSAVERLRERGCASVSLRPMPERSSKSKLFM